MPVIPAMCDQCGSVFASGFSVSNARNMTMTNNTVRCPRCGGTGRIPDGLYDVIGETIEIAATSAKSAEGLARLKRLLEDARRTGADPATVARRIEDEAPEFGGLAAAASKRTSADLLPWIVVVLQVLQLLIGSFHDVLEPRQNVTPELIEQIYRKVLETDTRTPPNADRSREQVRSPQTGRNEPCPRGSGKKYKRCHGR